MNKRCLYIATILLITGVSILAITHQQTVIEKQQEVIEMLRFRLEDVQKTCWTYEQEIIDLHKELRTDGNEHN